MTEKKTKNSSCNLQSISHIRILKPLPHDYWEFIEHNLPLTNQNCTEIQTSDLLTRFLWGKCSKDEADSVCKQYGSDKNQIAKTVQRIDKKLLLKAFDSYWRQ